MEHTDKKMTGWVRDREGLSYYLQPGVKVTDDWYEYQGRWYWFNGAGYAICRNWYEYKGNWYYFGADCAMVKGVEVIGGKPYVFDENGAMKKEGTPIAARIGENGVLYIDGIPLGEAPGSGPEPVTDLRAEEGQTAAGAAPGQPEASGQASPQSAAALRTSPKGIALIKEFEGCRLNAYLCAAGVPTIGYGHTAGVALGMTITLAQAEAFLREDLRKFEKGVSEALTRPVTQSQFDALVSFSYNLGVGALKKSTLLRLLNQGRTEEAAGEFLKWNRAGGKVLTGLTRRRQKEKELFLS